MNAPQVLADRNYYLTDTTSYGGVSSRKKLGNTEIGVVVWTHGSSSINYETVTLCIADGPFSFQDSMSADAARELAAALLAAADDSEKYAASQSLAEAA